MKKFLLFVAAALVFAGSATAQSLRFFDQEGNLYEEDAVITSYDVETEMLDNNTWHLNIKNTSDRVINVMIDLQFEELSGMFQFCGNGAVTTSQCYAPQKTGALYGPYTAAAGSAAYYFHAALMCISDTDYARVKYTIYDESNPDDKTSMTVILSKEAFDKGVSSVNDVFASQQVKVFQRGGNLVCNYNFDTAANRAVVVSNIVGARVASVVLDGANGEAVIDRLPKGVYVYTLVENGRNVKSHKVVIR